MTVSLLELLAHETKLVGEFIAKLTVEQEALKQGAMESLAAINTRKLELANLLNAAESERNTALVKSGFVGDRGGMLNWLAKHDKESAVAREWKRLMELAAEARELNRLNGKLIDLRLQATNQALNALTLAPQRSTLYGPDGHATRSTGSRIIDAA